MKVSLRSVKARLTQVCATVCPVLAAVCCFSASAAQPTGMRLPDSATPKHYAVELTVDPDLERFGGEVTIALSLRQPASELWLNGEDLVLGKASASYAGKSHSAQASSVGKDLIKMDFSEKIPAGDASITLAFSGNMSKSDTAGIFRQKEGGDWYALTQFEDISARRAFPCFDEPHWKTPWQLALTVKQSDVAVANTPMLEERAVGQSMKRVLFAESQPLQSYLVAFGVGPFDILDGGVAGVNNTHLRYITPKGRAAEARYAAAATPAIVEALEHYFGIPYPYAKLDSLVVPVTVGFGAMENAGLITYQGGLLIAKPDQETEHFKQDWVAVASHEISHQWFGDLVTAAWWDDIWLNESFATWISDKVTGELHPEWEWGVAKVQGRRRAMDIDRLAATRIIRQPVNTRDDLANAFDRITYEKGGAVLDMFENWMGEARFREGVHRYLSEHAYGAATARDFLQALSPNDPSVAKAFLTFIEQSGFPRVEVALQCEGKPVLKLSQRKSLPLGSLAPGKGFWNVPVCVHYENGTAAPARACMLLQTAEALFPLPDARACPAWVQANAGGSGYYRPVYAGGLQKRLTSNGLAMQSTAETVAMLYDALAGAQAGDVAVAEVLALAQRAAGSPDRHVIEASLAVTFRSGEDSLDAAARPRYARLLQGEFGARARALGIEPKAGDSEDTRLLRTNTVPLFADVAEDAALLAEAQRLAVRWLENHDSVDASVARSALHLAAERGDAALFERMHGAARATADRRELEMLLSALGSYRDPALLSRALQLSLTAEFEPRDSIGIVRAAMDDRHTRRAALDFVEKNYDALVKSLPPTIPARMVSWVNGFCDAGSRKEIADFFASRMEKQEGGARNLRQTLEHIDLCIAFKARQQSSAKAFLAAY